MFKVFDDDSPNEYMSVKRKRNLDREKYIDYL